jgi:hypothetical protein
MLKKIRAVLLAGLLGAVALVSNPTPADAALANGWNLFHIAWCYASKTTDGRPFLWIVNPSNDVLVVIENPIAPDTVSIAKFCADGNGFYVHLTLPSTINAFEFVPGLR